MASWNSWLGSQESLLGLAVSRCQEPLEQSCVTEAAAANQQLVIRQSVLVKAPLSRERSMSLVNPGAGTFYQGES